MNPQHSPSSMARALDLWVEVTGVDPNRRHGVFTMRDWSVQDMNRAIKEALEIDETDVTAFYLLDYFVTDYFRTRTFSVEQLMSDPDGVRTYLVKSHQLKGLLQAPEIVATGDDFAERVREAVRRYDAATPDTLALIGKRDDLGFLRRDALRSIKNLRVNQFLSGEPEPESVRPIYNKVVHEFWNVNSLLTAVTAMPSGVSLNMIRHPDGFQSYFVFTVRNGGNLYLLSDLPVYQHPLQGDMMHSRNPGRQLDRKMSQNWFPYDLLGIEYTDDGEVYIKQPDPSSVREIVPYQSTLRPLTFINQLKPAEVVWLSMMFDLIVEKFWRKGYQAPALSYTGEMMKVATPLIEAAATQNLPVPAYQPLDLVPLTLNDVLTENVSADHVGKKECCNQWLEERFKGRVAADIESGMNLLNIVDTPDTTIALSNKRSEKAIAEAERDLLRREHGRNEPTTGTEVAQSARIQFSNHAGILTILESEKKKLGHFQRQDVEKTRRLAKIDATAFGTREQLVKDRVFVARYNLASRIDQLASAEYEERKDAVCDWVRKAMYQNLPKLRTLIAQKEIRKLICRGGGPDGFGGTASDYYRIFMSFDPIEEARRKSVYHSVYSGINLHGPSSFSHYGQGKGKSTCAFNDSKVSYVARFAPVDSEELALLCGCNIPDLPDVLRHWTNRAPTTSRNQILDRCDPMDWKLSNPWSRCDFSASIFLSIRAYAAIEAEFNARKGV